MEIANSGEFVPFYSKMKRKFKILNLKERNSINLIKGNKMKKKNYNMKKIKVFFVKIIP